MMKFYEMLMSGVIAGSANPYSTRGRANYARSRFSDPSRWTVRCVYGAYYVLSKQDLENYSWMR